MNVKTVGSAQQMKTLGIDVAKHVFQLHSVDKRGQVLLQNRLSRKKVVPFLAQLPRAC